MTHGADVATVAVELQRVLLGTDRIEEFLADVAARAAGAVEHARACGVTVRTVHGERLLGATTDEFADRMDRVQYDVNDGPCLHCLRTGETVFVEDIPAERRWPEFARRGHEEGAGASMSVPLIVLDQTVGALNLHSRHRGGRGGAGAAAHPRTTAGAAFDVLRMRSQHTNVKLRDVAAVVVAEAAGPG